MKSFHALAELISTSTIWFSKTASNAKRKTPPPTNQLQVFQTTAFVFDLEFGNLIKSAFLFLFQCLAYSDPWELQSQPELCSRSLRAALRQALLSRCCSRGLGAQLCGHLVGTSGHFKGLTRAG